MSENNFQTCSNPKNKLRILILLLQISSVQSLFLLSHAPAHYSVVSQPHSKIVGLIFQVECSSLCNQSKGDIRLPVVMALAANGTFPPLLRKSLNFL